MPGPSRDQWVDIILSDFKFADEDTARNNLIEYWQLSNCLFASDPTETWFKTIASVGAGAASCAMGYVSPTSTMVSTLFGFFAGAKVYDSLQTCSQRLNDSKPIVDLQKRLENSTNPDITLNIRLELFRDCMISKDARLLSELFIFGVTNLAATASIETLLFPYPRTAKSAAVTISTGTAYRRVMSTFESRNMDPHPGLRFRPRLSS